MNVMDFVGLAYIFERKECIIDGNKQTYYEKIDSAYGFGYNFNNSGTSFVVLTGKIAGKTIGSNSIYNYSSFKTLNELCDENNHRYDYDKFVSQYRKYIGDYYTYDSHERMFTRITNPDLLQKIRGTTKSYDDTLLNNGTDISQMYSSIRKTIVAQDEQIMQILTSLFKNQRVINSSLHDDIITKLKENIIVYGATGTGKTEILKRIANIYKVPIVIVNAPSFSETGYKGREVTEMLSDLYLASGKNIENAQKGILAIDEFDKLAEKGNNNQEHVSRAGVQRALLKILDGSTFYINVEQDGKEKLVAFDTSKLSVVAMGAFEGIASNDDYSNVSSSDFVRYGIMRELMGRFSKFIAMNPLSKENLKQILMESDFSPLNTYRLLFESMNIEFSYDEDFVDYIVEKAIQQNSGARSLKTIFDEEIGSAMFRIFAGEYSAIHLTKPIGEEKSYELVKKIN